MKLRMTPDHAETIALKALAYVVNSPDERDRFMAVSGVDASILRARAGDPQLLGAVLDFMLANETLLVDFCGDETLDAREVHMARHVLAGG
jgi:hypothetical protein